MLDEALSLAALVGSAVLAGIVNSIAGGGTLLTFPSLIQFGRLGAVMANATSTVALVPGSLAGAWGYRRELDDAWRWVRLLLLPSLVGGAIGSLLMAHLPERYFDVLVPWLLLTASLLFLFQPQLQRRFLPHGEDSRPSRRGVALVVVFQLLVAIYGGYFGAGIGVLMITSLGLMGIGDIHKINAVKTLLAAVMNSVSVVIFVAYQVVDWRLAPPMAVGAVVGGLAGAAVGRRLPRWLVRWFVIAVGLGLSAFYFWRQAG